jgi:hypothetical protein
VATATFSPKGSWGNFTSPGSLVEGYRPGSAVAGIVGKVGMPLSVDLKDAEDGVSDVL